MEWKNLFIMVQKFMKCAYFFIVNIFHEPLENTLIKKYVAVNLI